MFGQDFGHCCAHSFHIRKGHTRMQRQRHGLGGNALGVGKFALVMAFAAEQRGEVHRFVGNADANLLSMHFSDELLSHDGKIVQWQQYAKHVPAMPGVIAGVGFRRQYQVEDFGERLQLCEIVLGQFAPLRTPCVQVF